MIRATEGEGEMTEKFPRIGGIITEVTTGGFTVSVWLRRGPSNSEAEALTDHTVASFEEALACVRSYGAKYKITEIDVRNVMSDYKPDVPPN
jgi:hypothetical protein